MNLDIGDPVELAPRETGALALAFEARRRALEERAVDIPEGVHADDGIEPSVDPARGHRNDPAAPGDVEFGRLRAEGIARNEQRLPDGDAQRSRRAGGPDAAVLHAERAAAGASGDFPGLRPPVEPEGDVTAMTASRDQHTALSITGNPRASHEPP